jgi:DNA-binding PadR family transcriptional regulator
MADKGRLQEPTFLILTALDTPRHGYGILQEVELLSGGRVRLRAGTLYAALDRLLADELVEASGEEVVDGRLRRYYRLTDRGAQVLSAEVEVWQANVKAATRSLRRTSAARLA